MAKDGVELIGVEQMMNAIHFKLNAGSEVAENKALLEAGDIIVEGQISKLNKSNINHTHIKDNIKRSGVRRDDGLKFVLIGAGKKTGWRAHFIENGTSHSSANPFIYPTFHENKDRIVQLIAQRFKEGMK